MEITMGLPQTHRERPDMTDTPREIKITPRKSNNTDKHRKKAQGKPETAPSLASECEIAFTRKAFGGYDPREVDRVIDRLLAKIEELSRSDVEWEAILKDIDLSDV